MAKRTATRELNHDNWDQEDEEEDAGSWKPASSEAIKGRVIKQARRKLAENSDGEKKNVFAGFGGFGARATPVSSAFSPGLFQPKTETPKENTTPASNTLFGPGFFQPKTEASKETPIKTKNGNSSGSDSAGGDDEPSELPTYEKEYLASLKALNETASKWIADHVRDNSLCVLLPVFRDYEKHLDDLNKKRKVGKDAEGASAPVSKTESTATTPSFQFNSGTSTSTPKPAFSFTNTNAAPAPSGLAMFNFKPATTTTTASTPTSTPSSLFSFGASNTTKPAFGAAAPAPFSFGFASAKPAEKKEEAADAEEGEGEEDEDTPPKVEVKPVTEDDAYYSTKCKLFYKKDNTFVERGVGMLHLKKTKDGKTQVVIRADTSLGNILLNIMMNSQLAPSRMGKNNVMMVCIPNPPFDPKSPAVPTPLLFRVKTGEEADELLSKLEEAKK